jgi:UDP-N-acetylmuramoylalanine--D-glutamate ligase
MSSGSEVPLSFAGKRVVIVGLARQGSALARFFCAQGARVTLTDIRPAERLAAERAALAALPIDYVLGEHPFSLLDECDLLCLSGGVPPETPLPHEARRRGVPLSNDSLLTLKLAAAPVIGITGSSGKTTTTTLVGEMLSAAGLNPWVGGNIGTPLIDRVYDIDPAEPIVLELSSFQLQLFDASPKVSAVLNVTPNHLDRHPSMAHYTAAKANILRYQSEPVEDHPEPVEGQPTDTVVLGVDDAITGRWWRTGCLEIPADTGQPALNERIVARRIGFSLREPVPEGAYLRSRDQRLVWRGPAHESEICSADELRLLGRHNVANVLAACAIGGVAGATPEAMRQVATTFAGVAHRLELVREVGGVRWYNDSIATSPERVVAALESFAAPLILLAGGRDKHLPWERFADLALGRVSRLILFGEAADLIEDAVEAAWARAGGARSSIPVEMHRCEALDEAVGVAARLARPEDVVLLSPGGTSFDAYRDFEERGEHFRGLVKALVPRQVLERTKER